jgi:ElaB/YqjD/DUF883 family membrane-anchored ribosome-binding protein
MNGRQDRDERTETFREEFREEFQEEASVRHSESVEELSGKSSTELENEIRMIRAEMDGTLRELERKVSPGELLDRALHQLPGGPREFANNLGSALRDNPLPATLTGIGIAWLMAASSRPEYESRTHRDGAAREKMDEMSHTVGEKFHEVSERMRGGISHAKERMHETGGSVREGMGSARARAGEVGHDAQERGRYMRESFVDMRDEHPVMLAGIGLAVGALIGAAMPPTRSEDRLMGEARDAVVHRAKEKGREQAETAEAILRSGAESAREETERRLH